VEGCAEEAVQFQAGTHKDGTVEIVHALARRNREIMRGSLCTHLVRHPITYFNLEQAVAWLAPTSKQWRSFEVYQKSLPSLRIAQGVALLIWINACFAKGHKFQCHQQPDDECASPSEGEFRERSEGLLSPGCTETILLDLNAPQRIRERDP